MKSEVLLEIIDHSIFFQAHHKKYSVLDAISFSMDRGELLGIVGESGCGKSMLGQSIIGLYPKNIKEITGRLMYDQVNLLELSEKMRNQYKGKKISMIFQNPSTSLNPVITIGKQMVDIIRKHTTLNRSEARKEAIRWISEVGLPQPEEVFNSYPHQLSGGMKQRVVIAMALSCHAELIIADEPTTALDVTTQFQILQLIKRLHKDFNVSFIIVTHDMGVASYICNKIMVMYAGNIVETGSVEAVLTSPLHPYTKGLLQCLPRGDKRVDDLYTIPGLVPAPVDFPQGCRFFSRCSNRIKDCEHLKPPLEYSLHQSDHGFACFNPEGRDE